MQLPYYLILGHKDDTDKSKPTVIAGGVDRAQALRDFAAAKRVRKFPVVELAEVTASIRQAADKSDKAEGSEKDKEKGEAAPAPQV
jgi:hypothetical protein